MAVVDFLSNNHKVNLMFFDHGTQTSYEAKEFLEEHYRENLAIGEINRDKRQDESWEEYWRNMRYEWFHSFDVPIITFPPASTTKGVASGFAESSTTSALPVPI